MTDPQVLLLPGWQDSGPDHWQSRWLRWAPAGFIWRRVEQADWLWPRRGDWMARLDQTLTDSDAPTLLVAHSLGCQLVAAWAAHSGHCARVHGALLVAPPDTERADMPPNLFSWRPIERRRLPFASIVVASDDDPFCNPARAAQMAALVQVFGVDQPDELRVVQVIAPDEAAEPVQRVQRLHVVRISHRPNLPLRL